MLPAATQARASSEHLRTLCYAKQYDLISPAVASDGDPHSRIQKCYGDLHV